MEVLEGRESPSLAWMVSPIAITPDFSLHGPYFPPPAPLSPGWYTNNLYSHELRPAPGPPEPPFLPLAPPRPFTFPGQQHFFLNNFPELFGPDFVVPPPYIPPPSLPTELAPTPPGAPPANIPAPPPPPVCLLNPSYPMCAALGLN